mmetsp:Transcript_47007/g.130840  ORF Transcript_47007/g.130840 Transcript_47007/m.130840 type:complete len:220 (+) Transcript_47007:524-1183(+)
MVAESQRHTYVREWRRCAMKPDDGTSSRLYSALPCLHAKSSGAGSPFTRLTNAFRTSALMACPPSCTPAKISCASLASALLSVKPCARAKSRRCSGRRPRSYGTCRSLSKLTRRFTLAGKRESPPFASSISSIALSSVTSAASSGLWKDRKSHVRGTMSPPESSASSGPLPRMARSSTEASPSLLSETWRCRPSWPMPSPRPPPALGPPPPFTRARCRS